jgi:hypothetical protein
MRTTVTLDADTEQLLRRRMAEQKVSFKQAINDAIRAGLGRDAAQTAPITRTFDMGVPRVDLDKALRLAGELEDEEIIRKMGVGR